MFSHVKFVRVIVEVILMRSEGNMYMIFDEMLEDIRYSKLAAFTQIFYMRKHVKKETM